MNKVALIQSGLFAAALFAAPVTAAKDGVIGFNKLDKMTKAAFIFKIRQRKHEAARGMVESRLIPVYPRSLNCPKIDHIFGEPWRGPRPGAFPSGADIPEPWNEPIHAIANGVVVAKFQGKRSFRGLQVVLRHAPEETGLPVWIFTLYSHFNKMPDLSIGQRVSMGQVLGPNGKTGVPSKKRSPHLHLSVYFNETGKYALGKKLLVPQKGHFIDPVALVRGAMPVETHAVRDLPDSAKKVKIAYRTSSGETVPPDAKIIWPFLCKPR